MTKNEEKSKVLNAFCVSVFRSRTSCFPGPQLPEVEHRDGEQKESSPIQREMFSDLLHHLRLTQSTCPSDLLEGRKAQHRDLDQLSTVLGVEPSP